MIDAMLTRTLSAFRRSPRYVSLFGVALFCLGANANAQGLARSLDAYVFVAGRGAAEIAVIDTAKDAVSARFRLPGIPRQSILSKDKRRIYAIRQDPPAMMILNLDNGGSRVIDLDFEPETMQMSPDGEWLAVAGEKAGRLVLIGASHGRIVHAAGSDWAPGHMVFDKPGRFLLLADRKAPAVHVIDIPSGRRSKTIAIAMSGKPQAGGHGLMHLAGTPGGDLALALDGRGGATMIDIRAQRVAGATRLRGRNARSFPTGNNQYFMVPNDADRTISLISTWTNRESERLQGFPDVGGINLGLFGSLAFVLNRKDRRVAVVDLDNRKKIRDIRLSSMPETAATDAKGLKLYVALSRENRVAVVDVASLRIKTVIDDVGIEPWAVFGTAGLSYCH